MEPILLRLDTRINNYASIDLMQGYNYTLEAHITDDYKEVDLTGVTVQLQMQKPDKKFIIQTENIIIEGNKIKATLDKDFTREDGQAKLQVVLFKDNFTFGSWVVKAKIKPSAINDNDGQSENKVTITETLVNKISEAENTKIELDKSIANGDVATIKGNVDKIKDVEIPKINSQLETIAQETEKPITLNRCDEEMLGAIQNKEGETTFQLLSIPRDNSVTPIKTTFMEETSKSSNLFNYETATLGKYLSASSGEERISADYLYSDFIEVVADENISLTECYNAIVTYYNTTKGFISGESIGNNPSGKTLNIANNGYIKISLRYLNISGVVNFDYTHFAVCKGNSATYEPYGSKTKLKDEYIQGVIDDINILKKNNRNYKIVSKTKGDYSAITEAVKNSVSGDTIIVDVGLYENEIIEAWGKTINLIGVSKRDCIIKNSTGAYHTPPLEASSGMFKNLSIIHEKDNTTNGVDGYAIHIEDNDSANKNLVFENCYVESQNNWAIGMGTRGGGYVEFKDCDLIGNDDKHGGLFFHDSAIDEYLGEQTIRCIDTNIFSIGNNTSDLKIQSQCKEGSTVNVEFIRTNVRNLTNGKQTKVFLNDNNGVYTNVANIEDLTNFNLSKGSYGNSMQILNY